MTRVLVIDDEISVRKVINRILTNIGYEVIEASNGEEAVKIFEKEPADIVITDMFMPIKDGMETIMEIQAKYPPVKVIAMSGGGKDEITKSLKENVLQFAKQLKAEVISKPFDERTLLDAIDKVSKNEI